MIRRVHEPLPEPQQSGEILGKQDDVYDFRH